MWKSIVALCILVLSIWTLVCTSQQYQYSRGWTPGKRSGAGPFAMLPKALASATEDNFSQPQHDGIYNGQLRSLPSASAFQTVCLTVEEMENLQRSAYVAGLYKEKPPFGHGEDRAGDFRF
ncbi:hypothetical protein BV898_01599 [Hypsibius exemplaris]|uniref:Pro-corazonin n=1 Tax=Hypsibius exemplaris TaxID=2072580 RepID=A0A1W0XAI0_HYPEX|nr:hypothetical protein BV898_01599 [Hypsibius exemplaris]